MPDTSVDARIREAAMVHARLLDRLIQETEAELTQPHGAFTLESLREWLCLLRSERRGYGEAIFPMAVIHVVNAAGPDGFPVIRREMSESHRFSAIIPGSGDSIRLTHGV